MTPEKHQSGDVEEGCSASYGEILMKAHLHHNYGEEMPHWEHKAPLGLCVCHKEMYNHNIIYGCVWILQWVRLTWEQREKERQGAREQISETRLIRQQSYHQISQLNPRKCQEKSWCIKIRKTLWPNYRRQRHHSEQHKSSPGCPLVP